MNMANWYARRRGAVHHGQAVVGADRERVRQRHDLLVRILLLRAPSPRCNRSERCRRGLPRHASHRRCGPRRPRRCRPAGELQRLLLPARACARPSALRPCRTPRRRSRRTDRPSASRSRASRPDRACDRAAPASREPGRTSAHSRLRANSTTGPLLPAARAPADAPCWRRRTPPPWRRRRSRPSAGRTAPYFACDLVAAGCLEALATSVSAPRRLPAAWSSTFSGVGRSRHERPKRAAKRRCHARAKARHATAARHANAAARKCQRCRTRITRPARWRSGRTAARR